MRRKGKDGEIPIENWLLKELLDAYEKSKWYAKGKSNRGVFLRGDHPQLLSWMEDADRQQELLRSCRALEEEGLVSLTWLQGGGGHDIEKIYLDTQEEAIAKAYEKAGRPPKLQDVTYLHAQIAQSLQRIREAGFLEEMQDLVRFLEQVQRTLEEKKSIPKRFFFTQEDDFRKANENLLALWEAMACGNAQGMIRVVSQKRYGDSKYLEKHLLGKLIAVLGELDLDQEDREETRGEKEERLLRLRGLVPYPEILAFCGKIEGVLDSGETFTTKNLPYGTYLDAQTVGHLREVRLPDTSRIITIENKANYYGRVEHWQEGELILFHGGFYSPVKGRFYRLIAKAMDERAEVFHWGDIDLGGFRMFHRLQEEIFPRLKPYQMDEETLRENLARAADLGSKKYRDDLASLLEDPGYQVFYEVIRTMLETGKKLEQEALL